VAGEGQASVSWVAPSDGGSPITDYTVTATPDGQTVTTTSPSAIITGLTNGTSYTFTVTATNSVGTSEPSAPSAPVTPQVWAAPVDRLSDFNGDECTDLVARDTAGALWLYPGDGAGGFLARSQIGTGWNSMTAIVTPGDVNGDGNADIIARDTQGALWLYPGNGASGVSARRQIGSGWNGYTITNAADMVMTSGAYLQEPDLLARDPRGVLWLYPLMGNADFDARIQIGTGWNGYTILGAGDLVRTGNWDSHNGGDVLGRDATGSLWLYLGSGYGFIYPGRTLVSTGWQGMTAMVTPGNWDRTHGNDLLGRDATGGLWLYPGEWDPGWVNSGSGFGFGPPLQIGNGWNVMTYIG
jgi:hypothetical protein